MTLEIRTYRLKAGTAQEFVAVMQTRTLPLLADAGITVLGCGLSEDSDGEDQPDAYLIRAFTSASERVSQEEAFYGSSAWIDGPREKVLSYIVSYHTVVLDVPAPMLEGLAAALAA